ncbi:AraC family transcriptional regulator [Rhodoferax koreense]|uniref:AraC family transcriptional regulator n=1 Tax=Rhodoferax koreensis TaxID=1842727 RepID=A0A1P8JZT2_9BURK|nr:helix-turn-helix transcriptional regulator [Rhodoferax koreense]APW39245.1 AraC family transcriptional regulator [Rhodoferax koreense]
MNSLSPARKTPRFMPVGDTDLFTPTAARPVRVRARVLPADSHFEPHRHAWAQLAYCATGMVQVVCATEADAAAGGAVRTTADEVTYMVPPSRAVWIAPGALHAIHVLERAELRTLYLDASVTPAGWRGCRVIMVSSLLRELIHALDLPAPLPASPSSRETMLGSLVLDEITHAATQALGVPLPPAHTGDKRLRALCEAVLRAPGQRATLAGWAADVGASERTMARLFRDELGTSYQQWRQQAVLAHALPMLARGLPVSQVAAASGYASDSAFSAMFKAAMGASPSHFSGRVEPAEAAA